MTYSKQVGIKAISAVVLNKPKYDISESQNLRRLDEMDIWHPYSRLLAEAYYHMQQMSWYESAEGGLMYEC